MDSLDSIQRDGKGMFIVGNTPANAYTDEQMLSFLRQYLKHRSSGKNKESFSKVGCDIKTLDKWLVKYESAFPTLRAHVNQADAKGWDLWESLMFNVGFGIPTPIPMPTPENPTGTFEIDPKYTQPHILMFLMRSKFASVYGDKINQAINGDLNLKGSVPCEIIDPDTKKIVRLSIGIPPDSGSNLNAIDPDADYFNAAMAQINKSP